MEHLNPLQEQYIKETHRISDSATKIAEKITKTQTIITVIAILTYSAISVLIFQYIHNVYISVLISIILLFFTIPSATHFYKKER